MTRVETDYHNGLLKQKGIRTSIFQRFEFGSKIVKILQKKNVLQCGDSVEELGLVDSCQGELDILKTNICVSSETSRANMLVLRTSNFNYQTDSSRTKTFY